MLRSINEIINYTIQAREGEREIIIGKQIINEGPMMKEEGEERIRLGKMLDNRERL